MIYKDFRDGPSSPHFQPILIQATTTLNQLGNMDATKEMTQTARCAPSGSCVFWGIPFEIDRVVYIRHDPVSVEVPRIKAEWLVFMHTSDWQLQEVNTERLSSPLRGEGRLNELAANYIIVYEDASEQRLPICYRRQIGAFKRRWGENCFEAVPHIKPHPVGAINEPKHPEWARAQTRVAENDTGEWLNWLWAWRNPFPAKAITNIRFEPVSGFIVVFAVSYGNATSMPLRWRPRRKALLSVPEGGNLPHESEIQLDLGQVISANHRAVYAADHWNESYNNQVPETHEQEILVEYTSHRDAFFHVWNKHKIPVADLEKQGQVKFLSIVKPAEQRVILKVIDKGSRKTVPVKIHIHGEQGEYLAPIDRHRDVNVTWLEDSGVDFANQGKHYCAYITGEAVFKLPIGRVYIEIAKGFEIRPVRKVIDIKAATEQIVIELDRVLTWRERGWVSADTHVHFLSPNSALLEGSAEGVNIVNLLATQWGEWFTNISDFDGKSTLGSKEAGGDGEYLVRVGTENRQHVLGHISLLGYEGSMITPLTTGGPDESALGDPIEALLTEWARQCRKQGGLVVVPHFPDPRAEHAATIVSGDADAVEMTSWGDLYGGINPYSLVDWYRYLNCGYPAAAVGGTDKMSAATAVGAVRTYARIPPGSEFTYQSWMEAIRRADTFVTYGPLLEFAVDGKSMGSQIHLSATGGTLDVTWKVASVTVPISRVELVVNGQIRESSATGPTEGAGHWTVKIHRSSWLALLVRAHYPDKPEIIAAHSSPVMIHVEGSHFFTAADAVTILEQIEGALAYFDTVGTRAETEAYKRMRLVLESAHRQVHNRLHQMGFYHQHTPVDDHLEH
jgi:hypothetical protein